MFAFEAASGLVEAGFDRIDALGGEGWVLVELVRVVGKAGGADGLGDAFEGVGVGSDGVLVVRGGGVA